MLEICKWYSDLEILKWIQLYFCSLWLALFLCLHIYFSYQWCVSFLYLPHRKGCPLIFELKNFFSFFFFISLIEHEWLGSKPALNQHLEQTYLSNSVLYPYLWVLTRLHIYLSQEVFHRLYIIYTVGYSISLGSIMVAVVILGYFRWVYSVAFFYPSNLRCSQGKDFDTRWEAKAG